MKKTIALLLAAALLCPLFAACGEKQPDSTTTASSETTVETTPPEDAPDYAALEALGDISGESRILFGYGFKQNDFKAEDENGTALECHLPPQCLHEGYIQHRHRHGRNGQPHAGV